MPIKKEEQADATTTLGEVAVELEIVQRNDAHESDAEEEVNESDESDEEEEGEDGEDGAEEGEDGEEEEV